MNTLHEVENDAKISLLKMRPRGANEEDLDIVKDLGSIVNRMMPVGEDKIFVGPQEELMLPELVNRQQNLRGEVRVIST